MVRLLSKQRHIVPATVELALGRRVWDDETDEPGSAARDEGVEIDLAYAEWVDISALVQLILLADALLRNRIRVEVSLPDPRMRFGEQAFLDAEQATPALAERLHERIARRERARSVLTHLRFVEALTLAANRWDAISFLAVDPPGFQDCDPLTNPEHESAPPDPNGDASEENKEAAVVEELSDLEVAIERELLRAEEVAGDFRHMSPLRWMSVEDVDDVRAFATEFTRLLSDRRRGLQPIHAQALANVIFHELLDNVKQHSKHTSHALVVAWARPRTSTLLPFEYLEHEQSFAEWVRANDTPMLEIVIGDSGQGLHRSLREAYEANREAPVEESLGRLDADVLAWAWDRWSTSRQVGTGRGTRGLYRVDRIVSMHQGLATIRAGRESVGWDHGGVHFDRRVFSERRLGAAPGTVARLLLPVVPVERGTPRTGSISAKSLKIRFINAGVCSRGGLSHHQKQQIRDALGRSPLEDPGCVVVQFEQSPDADVASALRDAAELRHPSLLVLTGLTPDAAELRTAIDTLTQELTRERWFDETRDPTAHAVWDPVLVLSPNGEMLWAGASELHARILDRLRDSRSHELSAEQIAEIVPKKADRNDVYRRLRHDRATVELLGAGSVRLRVTVENLIAAAREHVERQIRFATRAQERKGRAMLTPSLRFTRAWIRFGNVTWQSGVHDVALWGLAASLDTPVGTSGERPVLLGDANTHTRVLERLATFLGCTRSTRLPHYAVLEIVEGVRLIEPNQNVIIHTDVVVSGESVRRAVARAFRDGAVPVAVTCFADARPDPSQLIRIDTEDGTIELPITSLAHVPEIRVEVVPDSGFDVVSPLTGEIETSEVAEASDLTGILTGEGSDFAPDLLREGVVHFTHLMRPNGRHFTVWVNHQKLLQLNSVRQAMLHAIRTWLDSLGEGVPLKCEVWYPVAAGTRESALRELAVWLTSQDARIIHPRAIPRIAMAGRWIFPEINSISRTYHPVLIIDWGALDGSTISSMVDFAARAGAPDVFACVALGQLAPEVRRFLKSNRTITVEVPVEPAGQLELLGGETRSETRNHTTEVRIRFLASFTSGSFHRVSCPVCTQMQSLRSLRPHDPLMQQVLQKKIHNRMRPRVEEELSLSAPVGVDGKPVTAEEIGWILQWRDALEQALGRTGVRYVVAREIERLVADGDPSSHRLRVRALFHLLSVESQWLKLPPLDFTQTREAVAQLAIRMALSDESPTARLHAIIVLRIVDKQSFVAQLGSLFNACSAETELMEQLLLATFSYAERDQNSRAKRLGPLREAMQRIERELLDGKLSLPPEIQRSALELARYVRARYGVSGLENLPRRVAWSLLRDQVVGNQESFRIARDAFVWLDPDRSHLAGPVGAAARGRDAVLGRATIAWIDALQERWDVVRGWVQEQLLAFSVPLLPLIRARALAPSSDLTSWIEARLQQGSVVNDDLAIAIEAIRANPRMTPHAEVWESYRRAWNWWNHNFIGLESTSTLQRWVSQAPASVARGVAAIRQRLDEENVPCDLIGPEEPDHQVFCTQTLLNRIFSDLAVHAQEELAPRADERYSVRIEVVFPEDQPKEQVLVLLHGKRLGAGPITRVAEPPAAFDQYREDMALFGGKLTYSRTQSGDIEFKFEFLQQEP